MLSGAPAALVSYCQRHGQAAMCFAAAEPPGRRATAVPQQLRQQLGVGVGGGSGRLALAERNLSSARDALGIVAGAAVVVVSGGGGAGGKEMGALEDAPSSLYV